MKQHVLKAITMAGLHFASAKYSEELGRELTLDDPEEVWFSEMALNRLEKV